VPDRLVPLPLEVRMKALEIAKLSPVMTLGFPLGSQTQERTVNVSVTTGHVRRSFENMIQVDTSIYKGNSGGPIIDLSGKVIGIASAVAVDMAPAPVPVLTLLSDIGMVLPITKAAAFLKELKDGQVKWNGVLDLSVNNKIKKITDLAFRKLWIEARDQADKEVEQSLDPMLVMAAGVMHFCAGDDEGARRFFNQALSMDDHNDRAKFMLYLSDWLADQPDRRSYRQALLTMDWRSPSEFFGHLTRILESTVDKKDVTEGGYSEEEIAWLNYVAGLMKEKQGNQIEAEHLMREAVLAADKEDWLFYMALSRLDRIQHQRLTGFKTAEKGAAFQSEINSFMATLQQRQTEKAAKKAELLPFMNRLKPAATSAGEKQAILKEVLKKVSIKGKILTGLVYYSALNESWEEALQYARSFLAIDGRENADRLSIGLLESEILNYIGRPEEAKETLLQFTGRTKDRWYRKISRSLVSEEKKQALIDSAGESPEYLLTVHAAHGFWAEGSKEKEKAIEHYREALETYMDDRFEYRFAMERIRRLR
ncbi:MAG: trypsin-like peptidase domain-containing protein, partial [Desulfobacterales bacterium]